MKTVYVSTIDLDEELKLLLNMGVEQFAIVWDTAENKWAISYKEG